MEQSELCNKEECSREQRHEIMHSNKINSSEFKIFYFSGPSLTQIISSGLIIIIKFIIHFLPRLIKGMDSWFPTEKGKQSAFSI